MDEYETLGRLLDIRRETGLTRGEVARRMGVSVGGVASVEAALRSMRQAPSLRVLQLYAEACGRRLVIRLE
ncbi:MAG: helix-turn-helix transcriptional regulator [Betaproteobacteria bacterium]|nr:helix-turn-helix transcriptional regulator [Betaproteobacteria bacterium]